MRLRSIIVALTTLVSAITSARPELPINRNDYELKAELEKKLLVDLLVEKEIYDKENAEFFASKINDYEIKLILKNLKNPNADYYNAAVEWTVGH